MGIEKVGSYGGLYGNYKAQNIQTVDVETVKAQDAKKLAEEEAALTGRQQDTKADVVSSAGAKENIQERSRIANLEDVSLTFNKSEDFGYIGRDASLSNLDMEKAISDMRKDQVLEQYQYFVGSAKEMLGSFADGVVIRK